MTKRVFSFLDCVGRVSSTFDVILVEGHRIEVEPAHGITALHLLAGMGADNWIREYIGRGHPPENATACPTSCSECTAVELEQKRLLMDTTMSWERAGTSLRDARGRTPLWYAAQQGNTSTVGILIDLHRELLNEGDGWGDTPLSVAIVDAREDTALGMLEEPTISWRDHRNRYRQTYLHMAVEVGSEAVVDRLLELDANLSRNGAQRYKTPFTSARNDEEETPLLVAAGHGYLGIVKKLLAHSDGHELNVSDTQGRTPGHRAANSGEVEVLRHLAMQDGFEASSCDGTG